MSLSMYELNVLLAALLSVAAVSIIILARTIKNLKYERDSAQEKNKADSKILFLKSRYASMGETVGNIAHQWKQPLNAIGSIQNSIKASLIFQGEISKEKLLDSVDKSFKLLQHLGETIDTFYSFLSQRNNEEMSFAVADELESIRKITEYSFQNSRIKLDFILDSNPMIQGNPNEFTHALLNLILNAKDAFDVSESDSPTITVHVRDGNDICTITISDNAGGIRVEPIEMVFDLHISTKEEGSGLGLFMTKNIIEKRFGGTIGVENKNGGACFTITLPYAEYGEYFSPEDSSNEKLTLERINQLTHKIIELEELEKTLRKWADIFKQAHWGIAMHAGKSSTFELTNTAFHTLYGYTAQELKNLSIPDLFTPESLPLLPKIQQEAFEKGYVAFESIHKRRDGSTFPVSVELIVVKDDEGEILYHIANIWDLTDKKAAEERLLLKKFALDHIQDAVFLIDKNGRFHYINEGACKALGYTREEFEHLSVGDIDPDWPRERWGEHWEALQKAGSMTMELRYKRKDGTISPVEVSANYIEFNGKHYNMAIARDITERLQLEAQKENERMKLFFERQLVGMAITSPEKGWLHTNEKLQEMLGYTHEELSALTWSEMTYPEDLPHDIEQFEKLLRGEIEDYMLEKRFIRKDENIVYTNLAVSCVRNEDRSLNYVLALLEDITERKAAQEALAAKERELRALADSSPGMMGAFHIRQDGSVYMPYVSPNILDIFGVTPEEVREDATHLMALNHPDDVARVGESIAESAQSMSIWHEEYRIIHPTKGERWMESNTMPQPHPQGGIVWYGYVHDITERKMMEQEILNSHRFLNHLIDSIPEPIFVKDRDHRWLILNNAFCQMIGHSSEALLGKSDYDFFPPEEAEEFWARDEAVFESKEININEEFFTSADGVTHHIETVKSMFIDTEGKEYLVGSIRDITERKEAEQKLSDSHEFLVKLIDSLPDPIFVKDRNHRWLILNQANCDLVGLPREQLLGKSDYDFFPKEEADVFREKDEIVFSSGKINVNEEYFTSANGLTHYIQTIKAMFTANDGHEYLVGTIRDLSERKVMEDNLRKALEFNEGIIAAIPDLLFEIAPDGTYIGIWAQDQAMLAAQKEVLLGKKFQDILPPNAVNTSLQAIQEVDEKGFSLGKTYSLNLPEGKRWFELSISKEKISGNYIVLSRDVTERKEIEALLEKERKFLIDAQRVAHTGSWYLDIQQGILTWSDETYRIFEFDKENIDDLHKAFYACVHPDDREMVEAPYVETLKTKLPYEIEHRIVMADGRIKYVIERCEHIYDDEGTPLFSIGTVQDITERKAAEEALQSNRNLLNTILESSPGIITFALDTHYRYIAFDSKHAEVIRTIFGEEIALGMNMLEAITSDADREIAKRSFDRTLGGESFVAEEEYGDERLSRHYWQIFYSPIHSETGEVIGLTCFNVDITQRREKEETIRKLNTSLEEKVKERTVQLQQALEFSEGIINALPDLLFELDSNGTYLNVWARDEELLAAQKERLLGHTLYEALSKEAADTVMEALREADSRGTSFGKIIKIDLPQGDRCFEQSVSKHLSNNTFLVLSHDITESKKIEKALRESEETFRAIVENSPDVISRYDLKMRRTYVNPMMEFLMGKPSEELIGKTPREFSPLPDVETFEQLFNAVVRGKSEIEHEDIYTAPWGEKRWGNQRLVPEFDEDQNVISVMVIGRDMTERLEVEKRLKLLETAINSADEAIYIIDDNNRIVYVSNATYRMLGYTKEEFMGKNILDIDVHLNYHDLCDIFKNVPDDTKFTFETKQQTKEGKFLNVKINTTCFMYEGIGFGVLVVNEISPK